jgi:hypothetical protein
MPLYMMRFVIILVDVLTKWTERLFRARPVIVQYKLLTCTLFVTVNLLNNALDGLLRPTQYQL